MKSIRDKEGFINLDKLNEQGFIKNIIDFNIRDEISFVYNDSTFFFKSVNKNFYNELLAEEFAKDFEIPCAHYDLAIYNNKKGVMSESVYNENDNVLLLGEILYKNVIFGKNNNLNDIWNKFDEKYDKNVVQNLMNQLVNIFLFDNLMGIPDRHEANLLIIDDKENTRFTPIFDNELILNDDFFKNYKMMFVDSFSENLIKSNGNLVLEKFLKISSSGYLEYFKNKLWIIEEENIEKVFDRVEKRIKCKMPKDYKVNIKLRFEKNRNIISNIFNNLESRKMG